MKKWKSNAEWDKSIPGFHQNQITTDMHETKEQAEHVCKLLRTDGLGQEGRFFPVKTWVEEIHESCIPCNYRKHGSCDGNETGACPEWLCPFNAES